MRKSLTLIAVTLLVLATLTTSVMAADAGPAKHEAGFININTADAAQFALLPRVGLKAGERIVAYREKNGLFKKTTDLMQVKGIGDKTFELLNAYLVVEGKTTLVADQKSPRQPRAARPAKSSPQSFIKALP